MSTEKSLERIADALEIIAAGAQAPSTSSAKPSEAKSKSKPGKEKSGTSSKEEVSKADVREALKNLQKAKGASAARELLAENKAKTLTDLDVELYASVIEAAEERARD